MEKKNLEKNYFMNMIIGFGVGVEYFLFLLYMVYILVKHFFGVLNNDAQSYFKNGLVNFYNDEINFVNNLGIYLGIFVIIFIAIAIFLILKTIKLKKEQSIKLNKYLLIEKIFLIVIGIIPLIFIILNIFSKLF